MKCKIKFRINLLRIIFLIAISLISISFGFSQTSSEFKIIISSSNQKIPATIGKDTCLIFACRQTRNQTIIVNGGKVFVNSPLNIKGLIINEGKLYINNLLVADTISVYNGLFVNESFLLVKSIEIKADNDCSINHGQIRSNLLKINKKHTFFNSGILASTKILIADSCIIKNSPNAFISTHSRILSDYRKIKTCWYGKYLVDISDYLSNKDFWLFGLYLFLVLVLIIAFNKLKRINNIKLLISGLLSKIFFGVVGFLIYGYYYKGGDIFEFFISGRELNNLLISNPIEAIQIFLGNNSQEKLLLIDHSSGFTVFTLYFKAINSYTTIRIYSIIQLIAGNSLLSSIVLVNALAFIGIWKFYKAITKLYPGNDKLFAFAILFFPPTLFWASMLLKDTIVFSCLLWFFASLIQKVIFKEKGLSFFISMAINFLLISMIKPYVLIALIPFLLIIVFYFKIKQMPNLKLKFRVVFLCLLIGSILDWGYMKITEKTAESQYGSVEKVAEKARVTQEDHLRAEQYGKNNYNLGKQNGILNKIKIAPSAIFAGLFRPQPWDIGNILMITPAILNLILLLLSIFVLWKTYRLPFFDDPFLIAISGFVILYSYGIGISSSNFGALSRFQIMIVPFYLIVLINRYSLIRACR